MTTFEQQLFKELAPARLRGSWPKATVHTGLDWCIYQKREGAYVACWIRGSNFDYLFCQNQKKVIGVKIMGFSHGAFRVDPLTKTLTFMEDPNRSMRKELVRRNLVSGITLLSDVSDRRPIGVELRGIQVISFA